MCEEINMTKREISRANVFSEISQSKITQTRAAEILGISLRQLQRLYAQYRTEGIASLVSKHLGKPSNHQLPSILKARINELITCETYIGFGPTLMCEKLNELHGITIGRETIRQMMIHAGIWEANKKRRPVIHQQRKRRTRFGELVQIDGSPHAWFEERGDPCVLIVFIDDATGRTYGKFFNSETTEAYMITAWEYIMKYGRPLAFYSDKHGIFRINKPGCLKKELITQFGRSCKELDVELICANSPQAKGRVERNNQTQQDRLVKELRLRKIKNIEKANEFLLAHWWDMFNEKFAVEPERKEDAHRKLLHEHDLEKILCYRDVRKVSKNLEVQHDNVIYQITLKNAFRRMQGAEVTIMRSLKGQIYIKYKNEELPFKIFSKQEFKGEEINSKEIDLFLKESKKQKVSYRHTWNKEGRAEAKMKDYKNI